MNPLLPAAILAAIAALDLAPPADERECAAPPVVLVADGKSRLPIVFEGGSRERQAALYLAATIRDITGVRPDVLPSSPLCPVTNSPALRIACANSKKDVFRVITTDGGSVYFLGRSDFAVYDWCERVLGVRTYCTPKEISGRTFPKADDLTVPAVDYSDWPVFVHRDDWPYGKRPWSLAAKFPGANLGGVNVHAPHRWFADPDVRTNHPAIFALKPDGSRGGMPLLCYGNPETLEYYKRRIAEHISGVRDSGGIVDTARRVITVSQWDCRLECECEHCRRLFDTAAGASGSGSPIIWGCFLKSLAAWVRDTYPDYTVAFLPYLNTCDVPPALNLRESGNCQAMLCTMPGLAMLKEQSVQSHEERLIAQWAMATGRPVINWHYGCWPREYTSAPYLFGHTIVEHYRRMTPFCAGSFINGGAGGAAEQLSLYVWLRALWNPNFDVEALYDEFSRRMFGPAAAPMRRLIALQEEGWARQWPEPVVSRRNVFEVSYPSEVTCQMRRLIDEAFALTRTNSTFRARVNWYAADFAKFFADEEWYRSGKRFAPLRIVRGAIEDAPPRELVGAFDPSKRLRRKTTVRAAQVPNGVRFVIRCEEPAMNRLNLGAAHGELRRQDTLELYLAAERGTTYRIMIDPLNRLCATAGDEEWSAPGVLHSVRREDDHWLVDLTVPYSAIPSWTGLRGNVVRWHPGPASEREWSRLSTLGGKWNQDRDAFTSFILE